MNELATALGQNQLTAIDAAHAASNRSSKYGFISSRAIIDSLVTEGFSIRKVDVTRTQDKTKQGFQKHIVRLQHQSLMPRQVGDYFPEILLQNAHDGTSSFKLTLGIYKLLCSNGLVSGSSKDEIKFHHRSINLPLIQSGIMQLVEGSLRITDTIKGMESLLLSEYQVKEMAERAIATRFNKPDCKLEEKKDIEKWERRVLSVQNTLRSGDSGNSLWNVYNRIQENLTQGIRTGSIRRITAPNADIEINKQLWNIAESYLLN